MESYQLVMRSLRVRRTTLALVGCVPAVVAVNGVVLSQVLGIEGLAVGLGLVIACGLLTTFATLLDLLSRSGPSLAALRSVGARRASLATALLVGVLGFGVAGAVLGTAAGAAISLGVGSAAGGSLLLDALLVIAASAGAVGMGAYAGVGAAWNR
jgi:hypothetical protein